MPPHNSRLRKYGLVALALGDINVDVVVGTRSTGCPDFAKLVESFEAKNAPQRHGVNHRHRLRQPSRSYIVGASMSSNAFKGNCG